MWKRLQNAISCALSAHWLSPMHMKFGNHHINLLAIKYAALDTNRNKATELNSHIGGNGEKPIQALLSLLSAFAFVRLCKLDCLSSNCVT